MYGNRTLRHRRNTNNQRYYPTFGRKFLFLLLCIAMPSVILCTEFDAEAFVKSNYSRLAIDTTGAEPMIAVRIETDGNFNQLESLGINTGSEKGSRWGDALHTIIPIRMIPEIIALESVKIINYSLRGRLTQENAGGDYENADYGEVAGQISGLDSTKGIEYWIFVEINNDDINDNTAMIDSIYHFGTLLNQLGRFRITGLQCGQYKATLTCRDVSNETTSKIGSAENDKILMIIDSIVVKEGCASIIDLVMVTGTTKGIPASVIWEPRYRP